MTLIRVSISWGQIVVCWCSRSIGLILRRVEEDLHAPEAIGLNAKLCQDDSPGWQGAQANFTFEC
jgi:hypothetical protein